MRRMFVHRGSSICWRHAACRNRRVGHFYPIFTRANDHRQSLLGTLRNRSYVFAAFNAHISLLLMHFRLIRFKVILICYLSSVRNSFRKILMSIHHWIRCFNFCSAVSNNSPLPLMELRRLLLLLKKVSLKIFSNKCVPSVFFLLSWLFGLWTLEINQYFSTLFRTSKITCVKLVKLLMLMRISNVGTKGMGIIQPSYS